MQEHLDNLHEHVINNHCAKTRMKEWEEIQKRISGQVVLRMVSCVQIASKLTCHYNVCIKHQSFISCSFGAEIGLTKPKSIFFFHKFLIIIHNCQIALVAKLSMT